jgi:hypothetical protein
MNHHSIDPETGIRPISEWGPECRRGFVSDSRFGQDERVPAHLLILPQFALFVDAQLPLLKHHEFMYVGKAYPGELLNRLEPTAKFRNPSPG